MVVSFFSSIEDLGINVYSDRLLEAIDKQHDPDIQIKNVRLQKSFRIKFNLGKYVYARKLFTSLGKQMNEADIAHVQHDYMLFCLWTNPLENMYNVFRRQIHIPLIITIHETVVRHVSGGRDMKEKTKFFLKRIYFFILTGYMKYITYGMFKDPAALIVHTQATKDFLVKGGVDANKIHVIQHAIPDVTASSNSVEEDKAFYHVEGKFVLMTYGYVSYRKGQDIVVEELTKLPESVVYIIAGGTGGDPEYVNNVKKYILDNRLENRVIFTGYVDPADVARVMNAADVVVAPSREVIASGSMSEAIAYHKMIIAGEGAFVDEINREDHCIDTFTNKDELLEKIKGYMQYPETMQLFIANTTIYHNKNSYDAAAKKTIALYKQIFATKTS
jgi:glycosyltransferase involved in cell wall biosynthesis